MPNKRGDDAMPVRRAIDIFPRPFGEKQKHGSAKPAAAGAAAPRKDVVPMNASFMLAGQV
jgi:hypothetical protein